MLVRINRLDQDHVVLHIGPHRHRWLEALYVERGSGTHRIGGRPLAAGAGDLFLIAPGEIHDGRELEDAEGWIAFFSPMALQHAYQEPGAPSLLSVGPSQLPFFRGTPWWGRNTAPGPKLPGGRRPPDHGPGATGPGRLPPESRRLRIDTDQRSAWSERFRRLDIELRERRPGHGEAVASLLTLMLIDVARLFTDAPWSTPQPDPLVARVFGVIEARFAEGISLADVARAVDRSPAHLTSHVRRATGCTVVGWIVERRMLEARRLLAETSLTVAEIGRAVGYDNRAYFVRLFGRVHGVPPLAWRRGNHQGIVESER